MIKSGFFTIICALFCVLAGVCPTGKLSAAPLVSYGAYDQVASEDERAPYEQVGVEGMKPVLGKDIRDGVYSVKVESSSSMFQVEEASLRVQEGNMTAVLTLGGKGYLVLFMGTAQEAAKADPEEYIAYEEDPEGRYTYRVPVEALDMPIACGAYSKNKEKWYDRSLLFQAESLPPEAVLTELPDYETLRKAAREKRIEAMRQEKSGQENETSDEVPEAVLTAGDMADGAYTVAVELSGGSGRASVESPAVLLVQDGRAYVRLRWSSSAYDYMKVGKEKYMPVNSEGNSEFEIPVVAFDQPFLVIGDTTAMSAPHEVEYTLTVFGNGAVSGKPESLGEISKKGGETEKGMPVFCGLFAAFGLGVGAFVWLWRRGKGKG